MLDNICFIKYNIQRVTDSDALCGGYSSVG